jgi:hypothetical protein
MRKTENNSICPKCGAHGGTPIVYGYPDPDQLERSNAGEIELGGCVCFFDQPEWSCTACHHRWRYPCLVQSQPAPIGRA